MKMRKCQETGNKLHPVPSVIDGAERTTASRSPTDDFGPHNKKEKSWWWAMGGGDDDGRRWQRRALSRECTLLIAKILQRHTYTHRSDAVIDRCELTSGEWLFALAGIGLRNIHFRSGSLLSASMREWRDYYHARPYPFGASLDHVYLSFWDLMDPWPFRLRGAVCQFKSVVRRHPHCHIYDRLRRPLKKTLPFEIANIQVCVTP